MGVEVTAKSTGWLKPFSEVIVIIEVSELPSSIVRKSGLASIEKSRGGGNFVISSVISVLC